MNVGHYCTAVLLLLVSIALHIAELVVLSKGNDDFFIIPIVIFLFDVIYPTITIYLMLEARGLI